MESQKEDKKEVRSKTVTIRMKPSVHEKLIKVAKSQEKSLSKYMIEASLKLLEPKKEPLP